MPHKANRLTPANVVISCILLTGCVIFVQSFHQWHSANALRFACYWAVALLSSGVKITLPYSPGPMKLVVLFTFIGVQELSLAETLLIVCSATALQSVWRSPQRPTAVQFFFNVALISAAIRACYFVFAWPFLENLGFPVPLRLLLASLAYFAVNSVAAALLVAVMERRTALTVWRECHLPSLPYYLAAAAIAAIVCAINRIVGWEITLLAVPVAYALNRTYRLFVARLETEKRQAQAQKLHAEATAALHLRTIEALALAIGAKDHTTRRHLERVQRYAVEIGKELGLDENHLDALRAAALLHDIGKLAVPEHILSKPGPLTPEEFEKLKIHPVVGAEIVDQVQFPYPVAPIVRFHHEKWDGSGYPAGLAREHIPIGARILAVVDCFDSAASDPGYRTTLTVEKALAVVMQQSGSAFDPAVCEVLRRLHVQLEANSTQLTKVETDLTCRPPLDQPRPSALPAPAGNFLESIAAARQEVQALFEMSQDLGNSLSLTETLSVLSLKLKRAIPFDAIAIYILRNRKLIPEFVSGDDFRLFSSLEIPMGQGLSGWVAQSRQPIVNGNLRSNPAT